ncbi:MAG: hypothetical protein HDS75_04655 [Bacteroidales bacterium]|nr:hypothetical protein [Bacteroidales bacterium]
MSLRPNDNTMTDSANFYSKTFFLNASECNAQQVIPLPQLVQRLNDTATLHSSALKAGPRDLKEIGLTWVLSRLTMEFDSFPSMDCEFTVETWVESINRHFTERAFRIKDGDGNTIGNVRTIWTAMDIKTRRTADITVLMSHVTPTPGVCPVKRQSKIQAVTDPDLIRRHRFSYCDIDFNRHVNSTRYIETILNDRKVEFFDSHSIIRFEIAYLSEIHYDDTVEIARHSDGTTSTIEILRDGAPVTRCRIEYRLK